MCLSYEYVQFLDEKILQYLPQPYVQVGDKINLRCPICGDSKKSTIKKRGWVYLKNASYFCFNCNASLPGIKLLKLLSGADYESIHREYVRLFLKSGHDSSLSSIQWKPSIEDEPNVFNAKNALDQSLKKPLTERAKEYLHHRKVLEAPFLREPLFSTWKNDISKEFILIPWKINGVDAYYQVNDFLKITSMKYMFPKGKKKLIYGLDNIDPSYNKIFAFEGVYDSLFVKNGIATGTKAITDFQMKLIKDRWPYHEICIAFDNDAPGFASTMKMVESEKASKFFAWFKDDAQEKDINERILALNDINAFSNEKYLDSLVLDKLQMKLWMINNGKWKKERKSKNDFQPSMNDKKMVFLNH